MSKVLTSFYSLYYFTPSTDSATGRRSHRSVTQPFINVRVSDNYVLINQANCSRIIFSGRV